MRVPKLLVFAVLAAVSVSCRNSSTSSPSTLLASARIGPAGGLVLVESGSQAGLVLEVLPGVLDEAVEFRIESVLAPPQTPPLSFAPVPGLPFRIEPAGLVVDTKCRLRIPYERAVVPNLDSGPGNFVVRQVSPYAQRDYDIEGLDMAEAWIEIGVKTFGEFELVEGPNERGLLDYLPLTGSLSELEGGFQFEVLDETSAAFNEPAYQWRVVGPGVDERVVLDADGMVAGRRGGVASWLEIWQDPHPLLRRELEVPLPPQVGLMEVQSPPGALGIGAAVTPFSYCQFVESSEFAAILELDVLKVVFDVAYDRADLGVGQRQMTYWFSPTSGILSLMIDGVVYDRIP